MTVTWSTNETVVNWTSSDDPAVTFQVVKIAGGTGGGGGGGVTDHGDLTGLGDDDHLQYQYVNATYTEADPFTITDESAVVTAGTAVTLCDATSCANRSVTIVSAVSNVVVSAAGSDTIATTGGFVSSITIPLQNIYTLTSTNFGGTWRWLQVSRVGPAFDLPVWVGQSIPQGNVVRMGASAPEWGATSVSSHASTHGSAGSDPVTIAQSQVTNLTTDLGNKVPTSRTVNSKALSADITLTASDVSAVPTTRTVNSKALSSNITLTASDVGAVSTSDASVTNARAPQWRRLTFSDVDYNLGSAPSPAVAGSVALMQTGTLSAPRTVTLPAASALPAGSELIVNAGAGASATNTLSVARSGTDTINGASTALTIGTAWGQRRLVSDGVSTWTHDDGLVRRSANLSDLPSVSTARTNLGLGSLATASTITSADITDGTIVNADISASAAISTSKISGLTTVATDTIFDAAGDLAVGSGADTAAKLSKGSRTQALVVGASTLEWDANHYNGGNYLTATESAAIAETIPGGSGFAAISAPGASGVAHLHGIYLPKGVTLNNITVVSGTTAAGTPTNQWFALCDSSRTILRVTANDTTTAWGSSTAKKLALTSAFTTTYSGLHYIAVVVTATTMPSFRGVNAGTFTGVLPQSFTSTTGLTTPSAEGTTLAASTGRVATIMGIVS